MKNETVMAMEAVAEDTMDSLLKEIDNEMENTIGTVKASIAHPTDGEHIHSIVNWKLPLQEIGDETMEMIVKHNTLNNISSVLKPKEKESHEETTDNTKENKRRSVIFNEEIDLVEISRDDVNGSLDISIPKPEEDIDYLLKEPILKNVEDTTELKTDVRSEESGNNNNDDDTDSMQLTLLEDSSSIAESSQLEGEHQRGESLSQTFSKIPIISTVEINRFSEPLNPKAYEISSRISSGASDESATELATTIKSDKFNLLSRAMIQTYENDIISNMELPKLKEAIFIHPNISTVFSVATEGEGYRSAVEHQSVAKSFSENDIYSETLLPATASVEDLNIKIEDGIYETLSGLCHYLKDPVEKNINEVQYTVEKSHNNEISNLVDSDIIYNKNSYTETNIESAISLIARNTEETVDLHPLKQQSQSNSIKQIIATGEELDLATKNDSNISQTSSNVEPSKSKSKHNSVILENASNQPILPPLPKIEKLFIEDPFKDLFETSQGSINEKNESKPSDYLSIWHYQEPELKALSPAMSSNSQFSNRTTSTGSSSGGSTQSRLSSASFKFKPRIVSRSRIYNPDNRYNSINLEENRILSQNPGSLDPMRRNTKLSKVIQNNIRENRKSYDGSIPNETFTKISLIQHKEEISINETTNKYNNKNELKADLVLGDSFNFLPQIVEGSFMDTMSLAYHVISHENESVINSTIIEDYNNNDEFTIWDNDYKMDASLSHTGDSISFDMLNKLLESNEPIDKNEKDTLQPAGILKRTTLKRISIGEGLDMNGYFVDVSDDENNESILKNELQPIVPGTPTPKNIKVSHVGSPFKVTKARKFEEEDKPIVNLLNDEEVDRELKQISDDASSVKSMESAEMLSVIKIKPFDELKKPVLINTDLTDIGSLYLTIKGCLNIQLQGIKHHNARYSIEFDNGKNVVQTIWGKMPADGNIRVNENFQSIIEQLGDKIYITLKCQYDTPKTEIVEVVEKIPSSKKRFFGKKTYVFEKKFVQRATNKDNYEHLFARDGSFGRSEILLDNKLLKDIKYHKHTVKFDLLNEWTKIDKEERKDFSQVFKYPRKPSYKVGDLEIEMCFVERVSNLETFPTSIGKCDKILAKYVEQQNITKEGYMLQEGGDVCNNLMRRFFRLKGTDLIGYHEVTMQPVVTINLLKVKSVINGMSSFNNETDNESSKYVKPISKRNFTDQILFGGSIQLVFGDEEVINLNSDESLADKEDWFRKLTKVNELNICHQPWVKKYVDNMRLTDI